MAATPSRDCGKAVRKLRIAVTSACTLRCVYCLVDKDAGEVVELSAARAALELFLASPGSVKQLELRGGEALLRFDLVRDVIEGAFDEAASAGKRLSVFVATNGTALRPDALAYLASNEVRVRVGFSGAGAAHDRLRPFPDGRGSFDRVRANLPRLFSDLGARRVGARLWVHPDGAASLAEDFERLLELGFDHVDLEVARGFTWPAGERAAFSRGLEAVRRLVLGRIAAGRPVFSDAFLDALDADLRTAGACPFYRDLELYPTGEYSFYPYPFVPAADRPRAAVGRAAAGLFPRWAECVFDGGSDRCRGCREAYYCLLPAAAPGDAADRQRARAVDALLREIFERAGGEARFDGYARELKARAAAA